LAEAPAPDAPPMAEAKTEPGGITKTIETDNTKVLRRDNLHSFVQEIQDSQKRHPTKTTGQAIRRQDAIIFERICQLGKVRIFKSKSPQMHQKTDARKKKLNEL
jgi:hypothetical protein